MTPIEEKIQMLAGTYKKDFVSIILCTVNSVDQDAHTCECTAVSGDADTIITGVKLNTEANDSFMLIPAVGSGVLVATSVRNDYFVLMFSDIDKVICTIDGNNYFEFSSAGFIWNGGVLGGMVKVLPLLAKINALEIKINQLLVAVAAINTAASGSPAVPVTNATLAAFLASLNPTTPMTLTILPELEDTNIKH